MRRVRKMFFARSIPIIRVVHLQPFLVGKVPGSVTSDTADTAVVEGRPFHRYA